VDKIAHSHHSPPADAPGTRANSERYLLAAADQASGTRDERLAQVIRAKYEAGLLKPYDYSRGYARMIKWMEKKCVAIRPSDAGGEPYQLMSRVSGAQRHTSNKTSDFETALGIPTRLPSYCADIERYRSCLCRGSVREIDAGL
jgi:hypothetical protein